MTPTVSPTPMTRLRHRYCIILVYGILLTTVLVWQSAITPIPLCIPAVVCAAVFRGSRDGAVIGGAAGLLWDSSASTFAGFHGLLLLFAGYICGKYPRSRLSHPFLTALWQTAATAAMIGIVKTVLNDGGFPVKVYGSAVLWSAPLYGTVFLIEKTLRRQR